MAVETKKSEFYTKKFRVLERLELRAKIRFQSEQKRLSMA
jgi:hypothetical protein